jgi:hypothetical protein
MPQNPFGFSAKWASKGWQQQEQTFAEVFSKDWFFAIQATLDLLT